MIFYCHFLIIIEFTISLNSDNNDAFINITYINKIIINYKEYRNNVSNESLFSNNQHLYCENMIILILVNMLGKIHP